MASKQTVTKTMEDPILDTVDAALADFDLDDDQAVVEEISEDDAEVIASEAESEILGDDELRDLDIEIDRKEAYEAQTSAAGDPSTEPPAAKKATRKASNKTGATRTPRDINAVPSEFFVLTEDPAGMTEATKDAFKAETLGTIPSQVKVAEKFENLFTSLSAGKAPSTYVMTAFKVLDDKKTVTASDIVAAYKAIGLREGTARSQSGQIMNLFNTVRIADRSGNTLTLRGDSTLAKRLRDLVSPTA